jgi:hypothetical protein
MISQLVGIYAEASLFSWIADMLSEKTLAAIGAVLMIYLGYIIRKEILPILKIKRNRELASHLLLIADDVTDYFRLKFPKAHWSVWLDKAVDRIIDITGVGREVAGRAARASISRKNAHGKREGD